MLTAITLLFIPSNSLCKLTSGVHDLFLNGEVIRSRTGRFFLAMAVLKKGIDVAALNANTTTLTYDMLQ